MADCGPFPDRRLNFYKPQRNVSNLKLDNTVCFGRGIDIKQLVNLLHDLQYEFKAQFTDLDKIGNVIPGLNNCFSVKLNGEGINEAAGVFSILKQFCKKGMMDKCRNNFHSGYGIQVLKYTPN